VSNGTGFDMNKAHISLSSLMVVVIPIMGWWVQGNADELDKLKAAQEANARAIGDLVTVVKVQEEREKTLQSDIRVAKATSNRNERLLIKIAAKLEVEDEQNSQ